MIKTLKYNISKTSKILFMGSDAFGYSPLVALHKNFSNLQVVTHHTKPGIKAENLVSEYCTKVGIQFTTPIHKTTKQQTKIQWQEYEKYITPKNYDLAVICSYGFMIPQNIIRCFKEGMIVVHPSLLPKYRGGAPIFHAIANGDKESGVSFIQISENKFDAGNILYQTRIDLPQDKEYQEIETFLSNNAAENITQVIQQLETLRPGKSQSLGESSKASIVTSKHLDLKQTAQKVYNLSRAIKGARLKLQNIQIIVKLKSEYIDAPNKHPGVVFKVGRKNVFITCGDNKAIKMIEFKDLSKPFMPATVFIDRFLKKEGEVLFQ